MRRARRARNARRGHLCGAHGCSDHLLCQLLEDVRLERAVQRAKQARSALKRQQWDALAVLHDLREVKLRRSRPSPYEALPSATQR